jgi:hypothetical protein
MSRRGRVCAIVIVLVAGMVNCTMASGNALLCDSGVRVSDSVRELFVLVSVDGVESSSSESLFHFSPSGSFPEVQEYTCRPVSAARPVTLVIRARPVFASPHLMMFHRAAGTYLPAEAQVSLVFATNKRYTVRGSLGPSASAVWIEHEDGTVVAGAKKR